MNTISYTGGIHGREVFPDTKIKLTETQWLLRSIAIVSVCREIERGKEGEKMMIVCATLSIPDFLLW